MRDAELPLPLLAVASSQPNGKSGLQLAVRFGGDALAAAACAVAIDRGHACRTAEPLRSNVDPAPKDGEASRIT